MVCSPLVLFVVFLTSREQLRAQDRMEKTEKTNRTRNMIMPPPKNMNLNNGSQMMVCIANQIGEGRNRCYYNLTPGKAYRCYVHDGVMDLNNGGVTEPMEFFAKRYWWVESDGSGLCYSKWREYPKKLFVTMEEWRQMQLDKLNIAGV